MTPIGPITPEERIDSLDTLRGFALLGILPANILVFGMFLAAGNDPTVAGGATGLNLASWALFRILIEGKMRCLFSIVFGASAILLTSRAEERFGNAADIYYRRNLWLLLFGLAHAFLLFWGDILYPYALCALILFPFRKLSAKKLIVIGCLFMAFKAGWSAVGAFHQLARRNAALLAAAAEKAGKQPTEAQMETRKGLEAQRKQRKPSPEELEEDANKWRGNPWEVIGARAKNLAAWLNPQRPLHFQRGIRSHCPLDRVLFEFGPLGRVVGRVMRAVALEVSQRRSGKSAALWAAGTSSSESLIVSIKIYFSRVLSALPYWCLCPYPDRPGVRMRALRYAYFCA